DPRVDPGPPVYTNARRRVRPAEPCHRQRDNSRDPMNPTIEPGRRRRRRLHRPRCAAGSHAELGSRLVFTVEQRDGLRKRVRRLAEEDERVVAGAVVGSLAIDSGDRFSDVDLTFGIADHVQVADVLDDWTRTLIDELDAVQLADLERGPTTYRVFLLPDALQLD